MANSDNRLYYTIYKTTNLVNGKFYVGKHQTKNLNDQYLGSGKVLKAAIEKYGKRNFSKQILFVFDTEAEMNAKEAEIVTEEFCKDSYNLCLGGHGGFGYINSNQLFDRAKRQELGRNAIARLRQNGSVNNLSSRIKKSTNQKGKPIPWMKPRLGAENPKSRPIKDEYGKIFDTVKSLAAAKGIHKDSVARRVKKGLYEYVRHD